MELELVLPRLLKKWMNRATRTIKRREERINKNEERTKRGRLPH
jgi:hypothetical protein